MFDISPNEIRKKFLFISFFVLFCFPTLDDDEPCDSERRSNARYEHLAPSFLARTEVPAVEQGERATMTSDRNDRAKMARARKKKREGHRRREHFVHQFGCDKRGFFEIKKREKRVKKKIKQEEEKDDQVFFSGRFVTDFEREEQREPRDHVWADGMHAFGMDRQANIAIENGFKVAAAKMRFRGR